MDLTNGLDGPWVKVTYPGAIMVSGLDHFIDNLIPATCGVYMTDEKTGNTYIIKKVINENEL